MVRHVVLFEWSSDATSGMIKEAKERIRSYGASQDRCLAFELADNMGANPTNFGSVVVADFATMEDYESYALDARHVALIDAIRAAVARKASIQYEATQDVT